MANYARILVPTDFSRSSFSAFKPAASIAARFKSKVFLLYVVEDLPIYAFNIGLTQKQLDERVMKHSAEELRKAATRLSAQNADLILRKGSVQEEIMKVVKEKKIDLIVMGTCGRTGLEHVLLGSVTEKIVRHAPCQVLTVKPR